MAKDPLIVFMPSGKRGRFAAGTPVLSAARSLGVDIDSVCGGRGLCGRCQIEIAEGSFAKLGMTSSSNSVTPGNAVEARFAECKPLAAARRLSCQAQLLRDVVIDVPADSQVHKQLVRKRAELRDIAVDPVCRLYYVEVEPPDMHRARGDLERLAEALQRQWGSADLTIDLKTLAAIQPKLRQGDWTLTAVVHDGRRIIATRPGFHDQAFGIAFDIGSTTIAAHLCDLASGAVLASAGLMNPQIRFGEDLMSRVSYIAMNPGGLREMTQIVRQAINVLIGQLAAEAMIDPNAIFELVFAGNPIMHHLLLGIDPSELGGAPFALASDSALELWASEIEVTAANDSARVYVLPCIAGHVGADAAAVILSETPYLNDEMTLIVDIGTNAEIVLGNREGLLACSSPTGPAFEGAQISCGQRAAPGAVERVRIDRGTLTPRLKIIGSDLWSDEEGFERATTRSGITGICGSGIIEALAEMYLAGVLTEDGVIDGRLQGHSERIEADGRTFRYRLTEGPNPLCITQNDVRAIQLAKAALYAGARLLMDRLGIDRVERITLAGAFGSQIDPLYAMALGLIPDCDPARVSSAGNAAGTGARIALLNRAARREIEREVGRITKIETAVEPRFQEHFIAAMAFPHKTAPFPHLAAVMALPERKPSHEAGTRRRRRV